MRAYKFLAVGRRGRFSDTVWPQPGEWVEAGPLLEDCRHGVHACTAEQLLDWMDDELWVIELDGAVLERDAMVISERGRLLRRVAEWDERAARDFADACIARAGERAAGAGHRLSDGSELGGFAGDVVLLADGARPEMTDAGALGLASPPTPAALAANVAFVTAHAAGRAAVDAGEEADYDGGFAAERAWQLAWLHERLGVA